MDTILREIRRHLHHGPHPGPVGVELCFGPGMVTYLTVEMAHDDCLEGRASDSAKTMFVPLDKIVWCRIRPE